MKNLVNVEDINKIMEILTKKDPMLLMGRGGLHNEYLPEAEMIFAGLGQVEKMSQLLDLVYNIFRKQFSAEQISNEASFQEVADTINIQLVLKL